MYLMHSAKSRLANAIDWILFTTTFPILQAVHQSTLWAQPGWPSLWHSGMSVLSSKASVVQRGFLQQFHGWCCAQSQLTATWWCSSCLFSSLYNYFLTSWRGTSFSFVWEQEQAAVPACKHCNNTNYGKSLPLAWIQIGFDFMFLQGWAMPMLNRKGRWCQ